MKNTQLCVKSKGLKTFLGRHAQTIALIAMLVFILPASGWAQCDTTIHSNATLAEKIYLQLDGKAYTTGSTIWFKSIVSNALYHAPSSLSGVLYAELIDFDEKICEKKIIKIEKGIGQGSFALNEKLREGIYQIRAYTKWNKNFGSDFFFKEYINVFAPKKNEIMPISNITLIKKQNNEYQLEASFNPLAIDSLHKNKLKIFVSLDNKKDSFVLKTDKDNKYRMEYPIATNYKLATLKMLTVNQKIYSKTILINEDSIDLQFFPESGVLVHGLQSKVGFKSLDASGKGRAVQGVIIDELGTVVDSFKSNTLGMGSFVISRADSSKSYYAKVVSQSDKNLTRKYPLPHVSPAGNVLSVTKQNDDIVITAMSNYLKNDSVTIRTSHRGMDYFNIKVGLVDGVFSFSIPKGNLPDGILAFTLLDTQMHPVAERLYFNERPESRMKITLSTDKESYAKRELTKVDIKTTNANGEPIQANTSLLVINKEQLGVLQNSRQNILSYFLLDSELKGEIENPGFYFTKDTCRQSHLDALMLTQGWRKYLYSVPLSKLAIKPEQGLTVSGRVTSLLAEKWIKVADLNMITFGKDQGFYRQKTDSLGRFNFALNDEYGENINVLIQSSKKTGANVDYNIKLDKKESPSVSYNQENKVFKPDSVYRELAKRNLERKNIDDQFSKYDKSILLKDVIVKGNYMTKSRKYVWEEYGEPKTVIDGKEILAKEEKWSFGLFSVLQANFSDKITISRRIGGRQVALLTDVDITFVVIDGIPVKIDNYCHIPNIPPSEVTSIELIKYIKNLGPLYYEVMGQSRDANIVTGGIIAIYTHAKQGLWGAVQPVGVNKLSVPVFSASCEFYAPKYDNSNQVNLNVRDLRALIHWAPVLKTDSTGSAKSTFYNADNSGKMQVVVEAISGNGEVGYQEIEYNVKGK